MDLDTARKIMELEHRLDTIQVPETLGNYNIITIPDNVADALHIVDTGGLEYMRIVSTNAQPAVVFNNGEADIDFRVAASGITNAFVVQGSDGHIGISVAPSATTVVNIDTTTTSVAGEERSISGILRANPGAASAASYRACQYTARTTDGNAQNITGGLYGLRGSVVHDGDGTVTEAIGVEALGGISGLSTGGIITSLYGLRVLSAFNAGAGGAAITTLYGIYIGNQAAGVTNYAIYSAGGQSYHAGNFGIAMAPTANGILCVGLGTENLEIIDAGSVAATEQDWVEVEIGGVQGYLHVFAAK